MGRLGAWACTMRSQHAQASGAVVFVALAVILLLLIYGNRVSIGFDDPKIVVFPFGSLVVLSLLVGRVIGYILSNRSTSSSH